MNIMSMATVMMSRLTLAGVAGLMLALPALAPDQPPASPPAALV